MALKIVAHVPLTCSPALTQRGRVHRRLANGRRVSESHVDGRPARLPVGPQLAKVSNVETRFRDEQRKHKCDHLSSIKEKLKH